MADKHSSPIDTKLPSDVGSFTAVRVKSPTASFTIEQWRGVLRELEVRDKRQQIRLRPWFAFGVFVLLLAQNTGIWFIVVWALHRGELSELQFIFSALIAGTLTQSYFILRLITKKVFDNIPYEHNSERDDT